MKLFETSLFRICSENLHNPRDCCETIKVLHKVVSMRTLEVGSIVYS